ncbi:MAG: fluoride efflux transporter CrcB [Bdellovibrionota bacterium]
MKLPLLLIAFGSLGVLTRFYLDQNIAPTSGGFPLSTFIINILGSLVIGILFVLVRERGLIENEMGVALMVGLLGGFTTFSAFSLQVFQLLDQKKISVALSYMLLSPFLCVLAAAAGIFGARLFLK